MVDGTQVSDGPVYDSGRVSDRDRCRPRFRRRITPVPHPFARPGQVVRVGSSTRCSGLVREWEGRVGPVPTEPWRYPVCTDGASDPSGPKLRARWVGRDQERVWGLE